MDSNIVLHIVFTALVFVTVVESASVCYDVVGCFTNDRPGSTIQALPEDPASKKTEFRLFTREILETGENLVYTNPATVENSHFDHTRKTKVVAHGYNASPESQWVKDIRNALLHKEEVNVIVLDYSDWAKGSFLHYNQAAANTELVATQLKLLLSMMQTNFSLNLGDVHLIGHSLGAHLAGYVGSLFRKETGRAIIVRISGIDPASYFRNETSPAVLLDPTDAIFVDVMHTSGKANAFTGGFATDVQSGHTDFYVNDDRHQPGCQDGIVGAAKGVWEKFFDPHFDSLPLNVVIGHEASCSHSRAHEIYIESIKNETSFIAYPCQDYQTFLTGSCLDRQGERSTRAGYSANQFGAKGKSFLKTFDKAPFSGHHYQVSLKAHSSTVNTSGTLSISLAHQDDAAAWYTLTGKDQELHSKTSISEIVLTHKLVSPMRGVHLRFERTDPILWIFSVRPDYFIVDSVTVFNGGTQTRYISLQSEIRLQDDRTVWIELKPDADAGAEPSLERLAVG